MRAHPTLLFPANHDLIAIFDANGSLKLDINFFIRSNYHSLYSVTDRINMAPDARPRSRAQDNNGKPSSGEVLLITQILIGCNEHVIACLLGSIEQLSIDKARPTLLISSCHSMLKQITPKWNGCSLIEEDIHAASVAVNVLTS